MELPKTPKQWREAHAQYLASFRPLWDGQEPIELSRYKLSRIRLAETDTSFSCIPESSWSELLSRTKMAAKKKGKECTLTLGQLNRLIVKAQDRCQVTGMPFSLLTVTGANRRPFAPSIDRIDCSKGYTLANCRLVCIVVNVALSDWGEAVLYTMAKALVDTHAGKDAPQMRISQEHKPNPTKVLKRFALTY